MKNPFSPTGDQHIQFVIFEQITNAINNWMLNTYPKFDTGLLDKINQLEKMQNEFKLVINDHQRDTRNLKKKEVEEFCEEIKRFLSKNYPDISSTLTDLSKSIDRRSKSRQKKDEEMDEKLKKFTVYESLCEDVYKMRDEYKEVKKFMNEFQKKIKKAFEI